MVDIHSHILPGLDDGASSMEEAVSMAELSAASGMNHVTATSHGNYYDYTLEEYWEVFTELQSILEYREIPVKLYPGMEIFLDEDVLSLIKKDRLLTLNHTDYLLVEFPFDENPENVCRRIAELQEENFRIVLAHPERFFFIQKEPELACYLAEQGCVLQVNQNSILGDFGGKCQKLALQMLDEGMAGVIATDAHDTEYRSTSAARLMRFLKQNYSPVEIRLWLSENPSRILKGHPVMNLMMERE